MKRMKQDSEFDYFIFFPLSGKMSKLSFHTDVYKNISLLVNVKASNIKFSGF